MAATTPDAYPATFKLEDTVRGKKIQEVQCVMIETANTVDAGDTFTFDMASVGKTTLLGVNGCKHTTDNSVVVTENPTTTVSGTTITFTVPAGTNDDSRIVKIFVI
jgi:hypothetical protein